MPEKIFRIKKEICMKPIFILILISILVLELPAGEKKAAPPVQESFWLKRYAAEWTSGMIMGVFSLAVFSGIGRAVDERWGKTNYEGEEFAILICYGGTGYALGITAGTCLAGNTPGYKGSFPITLVASLVGTVGGICAAFKYDSPYPLLLLPSATSILAYELTRKPRRGQPAGSALIRLNGRTISCGVPAIGLQKNYHSNQLDLVVNLVEAHF
jgi:hypothetical protein